MELRIEKITSMTTYPMRHAVLRPGKPIETCVFAGDDLPSTTHWGAYVEEKLGGILSVYKQAHPNFSEAIQFQLRGMAVFPDFQGQSIGKQLLLAVENAMFTTQDVRIWCNARSSAVGFYALLGYETVGDEFDIPEVGPHFIMTKKR